MFPVDLNELLRDFKRLVAEARQHVSEPWSPSPVELWKDALAVTPDAVRNFRGNWVSGGTLNAPDRPLKFPPNLTAADYQPELLTDRILGQARLLRTFSKMLPYVGLRAFSRFAEYAQDDGFGGARRTFLPGIGRITDAGLRYALYTLRLRSLLDDNLTFFEVGGGFGGLCQRVFPVLNARRYILTDLPLNMMLSYYNLASHFGPAVGRVWSASDLSQFGKPIVIVAPWLLPQIEASVDLAINTVSFQHMSYDNLQFYGDIFERFQVKKIFHANRIVKRDPTDVVVDDYPFRHRYEVAARRTSWLSSAIVEELLARKSSDSSSPVVTDHQ